MTGPVTHGSEHTPEMTQGGPRLVCCRKGGRYFYKRDCGFYQHERPHFLAVEDPQDVTNDLARGSYNIEKVQYPRRLPDQLWLPVQASSWTSIWI